MMLRNKTGTANVSRNTSRTGWGPETVRGEMPEENLNPSEGEKPGEPQNPSEGETPGENQGPLEGEKPGENQGAVGR